MPRGPESHGESERAPSFEKQFSNKRKIEALGGVIEAVDIRPEHPKTGIPVVFAPGWGETPEVLKSAIRTLAESNRRVISLSHPRWGGRVEPQEGYPVEELRKANAFLTLLEETHIDSIDAVAHSEGAINIIIAASLHPEKFRNIVLVGPGGLIGKDKFPKLLGRFSVNIIRSGLRMLREPDTRKHLSRAALGTTRYFGANPVRALREAGAISASEIQDALRTLHRQDIGISIIHGVDDPVFPMERMQNTIRQSERTREAGQTDYVDGFYSVKGDHNEIYVHAERYAKLAAQALDDLAAKRMSM